MKKCLHCSNTEPQVTYSTNRARICTDCKEATNKPGITELPEQQLSDEELQANYKLTNDVTVFKPNPIVYEPTLDLIPTGPRHKYYDNGERIYEHLDKTLFSSIGQDTNTRDYGQGTGTND